MITWQEIDICTFARVLYPVRSLRLHLSRHGGGHQVRILYLSLCFIPSPSVYSPCYILTSSCYILTSESVLQYKQIILQLVTYWNVLSNRCFLVLSGNTQNQVSREQEIKVSKTSVA